MDGIPAQAGSSSCTKPLNEKESADEFKNVLKFRKRSQTGGVTRPLPGNRISKCLNRSYSETADTEISGDCQSQGSSRKRSLSFRGITRTFSTLMRFGRSFQSELVQNPSQPRCQNTFKLPSALDKRFGSNEVAREVYRIMEERLKGKEYIHAKAGYQACSLSTDIKDGIKKLNNPRHRIICQVIITQAAGQGLESASRFLWDDKTDNHTSVVYKGKDLVAIAMIYGVYFE